MPTTTRKTAAPAPDKPKRNVLTPEQRIAKLEAELAAARERAEKKANKERDTAWEKRAKLVTRRDQAQAEIDKIDAAFPQDETPEGDES